MPGVALVKEVDAFLNETRKRNYRQLLESVESACKRAKDRLGPNVVSRVYGRNDKQAGLIFKTNTKIAEKLARKREADSGASPRSITDVIGMTVVVHYPDQIEILIRTVLAELTRESIDSQKVERVRKPGYFATHVDLLSHNAAHDGLFCELQVKTMLHDAWSAKMHDLNYKPAGVIDPRLDAMMRVVADSLESIEAQSQTLRDLITERWRFEARWRAAARGKMFESMPAWLMSSEFFSDGAKALRADLERDRELIHDAESGSDVLRTYVERITRLKTASLREGWVLSAYLGSLRSDEVHAEFASRAIEDWLEHALAALNLPESRITLKEIWSAPLACYAIGEIDRGITMSRALLSDARVDLDGMRSVLRFNLANFLTEKEYFAQSSADEREHLRTEVEFLITECDNLEAEDPSVFHDLRGMVCVAFANTATDVSAALPLIEMGRSEAPESSRGIADAYYKLHARLAWRRLLELENDIT